MFEVPGRQSLLNSRVITGSVASMDEDYQMIDAHVEESFKLKIINWEYIDFSKRLSRGRTVCEDEHQHLEIINKNGLSYLSPISDRENVQINLYAKWEQAFRVYSNIITSCYPEKAPELLQYNNMVHSASLAYIWENVYSYDKEFRYHISKHLQRPWNVILQQVWTMILKDHL